ncbi:MAG: molybdopterin-guanine dinucleotide biosynthesis protein B [Thermodesulfovibrio sp.]|nr:molybdopterin-guanine dinucleotide biosynthesis protein B [Thermodesulfovibrio sp.]
MTSSCIIGISGFSGSGKTTLIEKALPVLKGRGLYVGVLKHTHHNLVIDTEGKDTDRFFKAGAAYVFADDDAQGFARYRHEGADLPEALSRFPKGLDLIIVEGYKSSELSRLWLAKDLADERSRNAGQGSSIIYRDDPEYLQQFLNHIDEELKRHCAERSLMAGLLVGGRSERMGRPKGLLEVRCRTLMEQVYETLSSISQRTLLLGAGELPSSLTLADRLPDAPEVKGPLAGMLSAFRWNPQSAWLVSSVDMPFMHQEAWKWVLSQRRPGAWAIMPRREGSETVEATGACYEPEIFDYIESLAQKGVFRLQKIADHPKVIKPVIPKELEQAWKNVNTPEEWEEALAILNV